MTYWFLSYARSQGMAYFNLGIAMAGVLGSPLSGWIMQSFAGAFGLAGWQWLFMLEGLPALILGFVVYFYLGRLLESAVYCSTAWLPATGKP